MYIAIIYQSHIFPHSIWSCVFADCIIDLNYLHVEKDAKPPTKESQQELLKKQLVKLCKTNLSVQVATHP